MIKISRIARKLLKASFFHVIVQGINKENIFSEERYKNQYLKLIRKNCNELDIKIVSYCIMDNHAHFLLQISDVKNLSKLMQKVNGIYGKYYNYMENGRKGYVFRDRYLSEPITSKRYLINCIKYIHMNPVKANIVQKCDYYKFSSYNIYKYKFNKNELKENEIFLKEDYVSIINDVFTNYMFLDIEKNTEEKIVQGISEFIKKDQIELYKIFTERKILIRLIKFLKNVKNIKYIEIREFFKINRGTMETITKNIRENK